MKSLNPYDARATAQAAYRRYVARTLLKRAKRKAMGVRCLWRRFYLGTRGLPRPEHAAKIQMLARRCVAPWTIPYKLMY